jgi:chromosome segregation ATPase
MSAAVLESVVNKIAQRKDAKAIAYRDLVLLIVNGKEPSIEKVETALDAAGKTPADLRRDVERCADRKAKVEQLARLPKLEQEIKAIDEKLAAEAAKFKKMEEQHAAIVDPLGWQRQSLSQEMYTISQLADELRRTCTDETLLARAKENRVKLDDVARRMKEQQDNAERCRANAATAEDRSKDGGSLRADYETQAKEARERLKAYEVGLKAIGAEQAALVAEGDQICRDMAKL